MADEKQTTNKKTRKKKTNKKASPQNKNNKASKQKQKNKQKQQTKIQNKPQKQYTAQNKKQNLAWEKTTLTLPKNQSKFAGNKAAKTKMQKIRRPEPPLARTRINYFFVFLHLYSSYLFFMCCILSLFFFPFFRQKKIGNQSDNNYPKHYRASNHQSCNSRSKKQCII